MTNLGQSLVDACKRGDEDVVEQLLVDGADPNYESQHGGTPLINAIERGNRQLVCSLLVRSAIDVNKPDFTGQTPLIVTCKLFHDDKTDEDSNCVLAKLLLSVNSINVNALDQSGSTALMYASFVGNLPLVEALVEARAAINLKNNVGDTALHWAVLGNHAHIVNFLLQNYSAILPNLEGQTPIDKASTTDIKDLLKGKFTSVSYPYRVDFIDSSHCPLLNKCAIGMAMCPGRRNHNNWSRNLDTDIQVLLNLGVEVVVTLMTQAELQKMKLTHLPEVIKQANMESIYFSITDKWLPDSVDEFIKIVYAVIEQIKLGKKIAVHCNGGKGRTGLLVVACLIQLGMTQTDATNKIRKVRPGMLQNPAQQMYLVLVEKKLKGLDIEKDIPNMDSLPELKKHKKNKRSKTKEFVPITHEKKAWRAVSNEPTSIQSRFDEYKEKSSSLDRLYEKIKQEDNLQLTRSRTISRGKSHISVMIKRRRLPSLKEPKTEQPEIEIENENENENDQENHE